MYKYVIGGGLIVGGLSLGWWWFKKQKNKGKRKKNNVPLDISFKNKKQYDRMIADIIRYPNNKSGKYREYIYRMKRPFKSYWCGYIDLSREKCEQITDEQISYLEEIVHGGLTGGLIGFDCAHFMDYHYLKANGKLIEFNYETHCNYKDHNFVMNNIKQIIDYLIDGNED